MLSKMPPPWSFLPSWQRARSCGFPLRFFVCVVFFFTVCKVTSGVLRDFWCVDVSCHPQSRLYSWARPIETELCCFAAGQLSWTISVVTALWSQVVVSVYHKGIIPGCISRDRRIFCFLKHLSPTRLFVGAGQVMVPQAPGSPGAPLAFPCSLSAPRPHRPSQ